MMEKDFSKYHDGAACSYDLTDFGENWQRFKRVLGLKYVGRSGLEPSCFVYMSYSLVIEFCNDPETGEYHKKSYRIGQLGYASYIGAYGSSWQISRLQRAVRCFAKYVKAYDLKKRSFA